MLSNLFKGKIAWVIFAYFSLIIPSSVFSADLFITPSIKNISMGETTNLSVVVSSNDQNFNAVSGTINFPPDKVRVTNVSYDNSIIDFWVQTPDFSNNIGTIGFEGVIFNPGYQGNNVEILNITIKVLVPGVSVVDLITGSVLANDGSGSNILTRLGDSVITVIDDLLSEEVLVQPIYSSAISSDTHPDFKKWYSSKSANFTWKNSPETQAVRLLVDSNPNSNPIIVYDPPINNKQVDKLSDGIWYFHLQQQNASQWSATEHFRFNIDTEKPTSFDVTRKKEDNATDLTFIFDAVDETSGIDHYSVFIDDDFIEDLFMESGEYTISSISSGKHTMEVYAVDKAGNSLSKKVDFEFSGFDSPVINNYPKIVLLNEPFTVYGFSAYENTKVVVWVEEGEVVTEFSKVNNCGILGTSENLASYETVTDRNGRFSFSYYPKSEPAIYHIWAVVVNEDGSQSLPSNEVVVRVKDSLFGLILKNLSKVVLGLILILLISISIIYTYLKTK